MGGDGFVKLGQVEELLTDGRLALDLSANQGVNVKVEEAVVLSEVGYDVFLKLGVLSKSDIDDAWLNLSEDDIKSLLDVLIGSNLMEARVLLEERQELN